MNEACVENNEWMRVQSEWLGCCTCAANLPGEWDVGIGREAGAGETRLVSRTSDWRRAGVALESGAGPGSESSGGREPSDGGGRSEERGVEDSGRGDGTRGRREEATEESLETTER